MMGRFILLARFALALSAVFMASSTLAEGLTNEAGKGAEKRSEKETQGKQKEGKGHDQGVLGDRDAAHVKASQYFSEETRILIHKYYGEQFWSRRCPPGLAKRGNGCMPPGQAKKWMIGQALPPDIIFYDLPPEVLVQIGPVPSRHRFVRVAADILMIAVGTGMVVDAIEDIGREMGR
jgi:hypothetical protein